MDILAVIPSSRSSIIGVSISIGGNVLIAIALNTQKLAHSKAQGPLTSRSHRQPQSSIPNDTQDNVLPPVYVMDYATDTLRGPVKNPAKVIQESGQNGVIPVVEAIPEDVSEQPVKGRLQKKWMSVAQENGHLGPAGPENGPIEGIRSRRSSRSRKSGGKKGHSTSGRMRSEGEQKHTLYYQSKTWWLGVLLMALGELGNFTSYAFAPASVVAPLGTTALIANCFIAPLRKARKVPIITMSLMQAATVAVLKERFRKKDLLGIALSILGAVIVVLSAKSQNQSLSPAGLLQAISQPAFIVYSSISLGLIIFLIVLSKTPFARRYIFINLGVCALCGGFTVLSTKAFSGLLTLNFVDAFKTWITYPILAVLASTAILQLIFLNRALQDFESRVVVPTQFVTFTISAIIGSAILYRDFENTSAGKIVEFFVGCVFVFLGVVILTKGKGPNQDDQPKFSREPRNYDSPAITIHTAEDEELPPISVEGTSRSSNENRPRSTSQTLTSLLPRTSATVSEQRDRSIRKHRSFGTFPVPRSSSYTSSRSPNMIALASAKPFSPGYILIAGGSLGERLLQEQRKDIESGSTSNENSGHTSEASSDDEAGERDALLDGVGRQLEVVEEAEMQGEPETEALTASQVMRRSETV